MPIFFVKTKKIDYGIYYSIFLIFYSNVILGQGVAHVPAAGEGGKRPGEPLQDGDRREIQGEGSIITFINIYIHCA